MAEDLEMKRPFMDHLDELLKRVRRSFLYLVLGFLAAYGVGDRIVQLLTSQVSQIPFLPEGVQVPRIIVTAPFEKFWVYLRVAMIAGFSISSPLIAWEVAKFVGPGLKDNEKGRIKTLCFSIFLTLLLGLFVGYRWVLPMILSAIVRFGNDQEIVNTWSLGTYISSSLGVLLVTALLFQLPVVMTHLSAWGWVRAKNWSAYRRHAIVANAIVSAILSPPDIQSMIAMMVPVHLLYEAGIIFSKMAEWGRKDLNE